MEPVSDNEIVTTLHGAPEWITLELMRDTLDTFQPYYAERLTADDANEMLRNVGNLFAVLKKIDENPRREPPPKPNRPYRKRSR